MELDIRTAISALKEAKVKGKKKKKVCDQSVEAFGMWRELAYCASKTERMNTPPGDSLGREHDSD